MGALVRESLWPTTRLGRVVLAVVLLRPILLWLVPLFLHHEPIAVTALYRPSGDIQYLELIGALGRGVLGESNVFELAGRGIHPFPVASIGGHALAFALGGGWGLAVADVIATYVYFVSACLLYRVCTLSPRAAVLLAGAVVTSLYAVLWPITDRLGWGKDLMWGDRFPRPFVSTIFWVWSLTAIAVLWLRRERPGSRFWLLAGVALSLTVQSDVHAAFIAALALASVYGARFVATRDERPALIKGALIAAAIAVVCSIPFVVQRTGMRPDILQRWGAYPMSRATALSMILTVPPWGPALVAVAAAMAWRVDRRVAALWLIVTAAAFVAFPLFSFLTGQGLYPYHFADRLKRVSFEGAAILGALALAPLAARWPRAKAAATWGLVAAMAASVGVRVAQNSARRDHPHASMYDLRGYRAAFTELTRELDGPRYRDARVLATIDQAVHVYWQTFRSGHSFLPDAFVSLATDDEIEARSARFGHLLGMSPERFLTLWRDPTTVTLFFGSSKYAVNSVHALAPDSEYTPEQVREIHRRSPYVSFQQAVPRSTLERLSELYARAPSPPEPRLDVVVLTNDPAWAELAPGEPFELTFNNRVFRVYSRASTSQRR